MLTLKETVKRLQAFGLPITRKNHQQLAEQIHPYVDRGLLFPAVQDLFKDLPEYAEYQRAQALPHENGDWTDMAAQLVLLSQWRHAMNTALIAQSKIALILCWRCGMYGHDGRGLPLPPGIDWTPHVCHTCGASYCASED